MRTCRLCGKNEDEVAFYDPATSTGRSAGSACRACWVAKSLAWRDANRTQWNRTRHRSATMKKFGITKEQYEAIMAPGVCATCGSTERLCVDHDHTTGVVRGLLCRSCNLVVHSTVTPDTLRNLAAYLEIT